MRLTLSVLVLAAVVLCACDSVSASDRRMTRLTVTVDRGRDIGQNFGSLFQARSDDGSIVVGAGFQNGYNTRYRADRHALQFYVRPAGGKRTFVTENLPRPNDLCGTYLYGRDGVVYSTYGGFKAWTARERTWKDATGVGSGANEIMRVGKGVLEFGDSTVKYNGRTILGPPDEGYYQQFFYADGHLCFYHVNRRGGDYRPYEDDNHGFSKLYACPWTTDQTVVDLSKAVVLTLPVVGETTFAWGQLGRQIVTGSNIGGFYVFEAGDWRMLLEPTIHVSYQLYSTVAFHDRLLMGHYPTGHVLEFDGKKITDLAGPPKMDGVSGSAREAQTTVIYGGDLFVGVWPWGELWRYNPDSHTWTLVQRMFDHPHLSDQIVHPYDVENQSNPVGNLWGQRVTSLIPNGPDLFIATSAKSPIKWDPGTFPFLAPEKWKSYGSVYRMTMPGHLSAAAQWTDSPTAFEFTILGAEIKIAQDGKQLASATLNGPLAERLNGMSHLRNITWGEGIYGPFAGTAISGTIDDQ